MKREKIGKGYFQAGYGRGFKSSPVIWLINGKAYAKDSANADGLYPLSGELCGYVRVNIESFYGNFHEVTGPHNHHEYVEGA